MGSGVVLVTRTWTLGNGVKVQGATLLAICSFLRISTYCKESVLRNRCLVCGEVLPPLGAHPQVESLQCLQHTLTKQ